MFKKSESLSNKCPCMIKLSERKIYHSNLTNMINNNHQF